MRVLMGAFGTRGDVQPMVALAQALLARGHQVSMVVPPNSAQWVGSFGLSVSPAGVDYQWLTRQVAHGTVGLKVLAMLRREVQAQLEVMEPLAESADLIVGCSIFAVGSILAERIGRPYAFVSFCPQLFPSAEHPSPVVTWQRLPRWLNRVSWWVTERLWEFLLRAEVNRARRARGLRSVRHIWPELLGHHPLVACETALAAAPKDHRAPIHQVGALFLEERESLSEATEAFLQAGPPPVYLGFGSMADPHPEGTTARLLESVRQAGVRAVVSQGWAGLGVERCPPEVLVVGPEPHGKLFPRCAAVVHHGGAGTTHAAVRAGTPQILMPQLLDQHYWAHRVQQAGLGPAPVSRYATNPRHLALALRRCVDTSTFRQRAQELSAQMQQDGATRAATYLESL